MKTTWRVNTWNIQVAIEAYTFPKVLDNLYFFHGKKDLIILSPSQSSLPQPSSFISHNLLNPCYIPSSVSGARSHHLSSLLHLCKVSNIILLKKEKKIAIAISCDREQLIAGLPLAQRPHSSLLNMKTCTVHQYQTKSMTRPSPRSWAQTEKHLQARQLPWKQPPGDARVVGRRGLVPTGSTNSSPM